MTSWLTKHDRIVGFGCMLILAAVFITGGVMNAKADKQREERQDKYLRDHRCVTVSFAGKYAEPVYQCNNGLVMRKQIP